MRAATLDEFRAHFKAALEETIINDELKRQEKWASAVAVGSQECVEAVERRIRARQQMDARQESRTWVLREEYGSFFERQNGSIAQF